MAGVDPRGVVVAEQSGVTLRKCSETGDVGRPAVAVVLDAERTDATSAVRLIETLPDGLEANDVGFFETDGRQPWAVKGPKLVLETDLEPGETLESWIGARGKGAEAIEELLGEPDEFEVRPADGPGPDALAERLLAELRSGDVPAETRRALRSALAPDAGALETRVRQLQADVADLRTYAGATEDLIDAHGPPAAVVERLERRLERLEAVAVSRRDLAAVEADVADLEASHAAVAADVERVEARLGTDVQERLAALSDRLDEVTRLVSGLPFLEEVGPDGSVVAADELSAVEADVSALEAAVADLEAGVGALESDVAALSAEVERLERGLPDRDVEERLAELSDRVETVSEFATGLRTALEQ